MARKGLFYNGGVLGSSVSGYLDNIQVNKKQVIKKTWIASKRRKRSKDGERGSRYH